MSSIVSVVFEHTREYELVAHPMSSRDEANLWLDQQWELLECEPSNPMGKVLILDKILGIAKYAGEKRFEEPGIWVQEYANAVATALDRPVVRVDIADRIVG